MSRNPPARPRLTAGRTACALLVLLALSGCEASADTPKTHRRGTKADFPAPHRPVSGVGSPRWSTEEARDRLREAETVMDRAKIAKGMTVADIGAGEGYYTVRLAARVGEDGRVLAQDIVPEVRDALADRVARDSLDTVSVRLGEPADPKLPAGSFDRVLMVHMYHEIASPYEFLWNLRPALRPGGRVIVVDADRPTDAHGTPPALMDCEFAAVGYVLVDSDPMKGQGGYLRAYAPDGPRPAPGSIRSCGTSDR